MFIWLPFWILPVANKWIESTEENANATVEILCCLVCLTSSPHLSLGHYNVHSWHLKRQLLIVYQVQPLFISMFLWWNSSERWGEKRKKTTLVRVFLCFRWNQLYVCPCPWPSDCKELSLIGWVLHFAKRLEFWLYSCISIWNEWE